MLRYPITLLLLGLVLTTCKELGESQEFVYDDTNTAEPQHKFSSFLSMDDAPDGETVDFDLDFDFDFNVSDILNTTAIIDTVTEIMEPIGDKIDAVGQQLDAAITWVTSVTGEGIQEGIQDVVKSIQEPIGQHIDAVLAWVGGDELKKPEVVDGETVLEAGEEGFSVDDELIVPVEEEEATTVDVTAQEKVEEVPITIETVEAQAVIEEVPVIVEEMKITPLPVAAPLEDIDELVVMVNYEDILAAMNSPNATVDTIESEPFYLRFYEVFMGKEVEIGVGGARLLPVEETKKKSYFLSYDAL